jgi:hypothetical protein
MSHTTKVGLWLVPWFPALILCLATYLYFETPEYTVVSVVKMVPDSSGIAKSISVEKPPFAFHATPFAVFSWILLAMFLVGIVLLVVSAAARLSARRGLKV